MIFMTETQLVESNQSTSMLRRGLLENNSTMRRRDLQASNKIVIQIQITKIRTVMMKMMTDTTTKREATTIGETQTTEAEAVVVNHITKTTKIVARNTTEIAIIVIIVITKGMMMNPATIIRTMFTLIDTNELRNMVHMMSKLAIHRTTLSTIEDIPELKMT